MLGKISFSQYLLPAAFVCLISMIACQPESAPISTLDEELIIDITAVLSEGVNGLRMPASDQLDQIPFDPKNPLNKEKIDLGKKLFHDTGLGINPRFLLSRQTYSCATCHHAAAGFQAGIKQGIGEGGIGFGLKGEARKPRPGFPLDSLDVQPIRTPSALNGAFQKITLWNGQFGATGMNTGTDAQWAEGTPMEVNLLGYEGLETQAIAGLGVHRMSMTGITNNYQEYKRYFDDAFPDVPENIRYSDEQAGKAIAAYERTLLANQAPFQRWLRGEYDAMTETQKVGAQVFFGKGKCYTCHQGPALNSMSFHAIGMKDLEGPGTYGTSAELREHLGRGGFTGKEKDLYAFKTPQLYNLKDAPFYGHGGSMTSIEAVIRYKNAAVKENPEVPNAKLSPQFKPLELTEVDIQVLVDFVSNALYDPSLDRYVPASVPSGLCFPNNDEQSRADLGCN